MRKKYLILLLIPLLIAFAGCGGKKKYIAPEPAPFAPSNLSATAVSITQIDLSWKDNSTNEKGFIVHRKLPQQGYTSQAYLDPNTTSYSDSSLDSRGIYRYKVSAYNDDGESGFSNEAVVKIVEILEYHMYEHHVVALEWRTRMVGMVKNHTNQTLTIQGKGRFFNYSDVVVLVGTFTLGGVPAGEIRPFEISHYGERIERVDAWVDYYR